MFGTFRFSRHIPTEDSHNLPSPMIRTAAQPKQKEEKHISHIFEKLDVEKRQEIMERLT